MAGKGVVRSIKNYAKGFSDVQIKVREATSNDTWGPSGSLMNEIAQLTFNEQDFIEIMDMIDRRLNDKGKNWRHVFKALLVLDYCLHVGSENVVLYAKENIYVVKTLKEFQHVDDTGKDVGFNVRQKAKDVTSLLLDDQRLKEERRSRHQMQDRMAGVGDYMNDVLWGSKSSGGGGQDHQVYQQPGYKDEDKDLKRAIEESRRTAEQEHRKRGEGTDKDLERALRESEQEAREAERKKREALERDNQNNLFGNSSGLSNNATPQSSFQPFPTNQSIDFSSATYGQQQQLQQQQQWPQSTGLTGMSFLEPIQQQNNGFNNPYQNNLNQFNLQAQMTGMPSSMQAQMTGMPEQQQMAGNPFSQFAATQNNNSASVGGNGMFGTPSQAMQTTAPAMGQSAPTPAMPPNQHYNKLNSMLANREGGADSFADSPTKNQNGAFSQPFGQQPSRNPFGTATSSSSTPTTPRSGQKSLKEMMQQQQLQAQMTGYQQPQTTGLQQSFQHTQMTGYQPQQQPSNFQLASGQQQQQTPFF
ncbi:hypothetical protein [Parasitella parasitica]|uniref:ENTH domain-containing protein n=1 Tax=Parasitella parasitica TaxID=35722 RepID=A0A0B7N780_9FUNG|nr:hypothetical protein [Parasitella parasitica]